MDGKVLLNVFSKGVKNDLLSILVESNDEFLEVNSQDELGFKYNLIKKDLELYIHELDEKDYDASIAQLRRIDTGQYRSVVLIHAYSSQVIDDCLAMKVKDIVVLPIEKENLRRKIISTSIKLNKLPLMPNNPEGVIDKLPDTEPIDKGQLIDEINRAIRGDYPLSFVIIQYEGMIDEFFRAFKRDLRKLLRTTDRILRYKDNQLLLLCPFTPKTYLVEVENKIRVAYEKQRKRSEMSTSIYLYGVTFPNDGEKMDSLLEMLEDGIHDSKVFSKLNGTLSQMNRDDIEKKLKRNY